MSFYSITEIWWKVNNQSPDVSSLFMDITVNYFWNKIIHIKQWCVECAVCRVCCVLCVVCAVCYECCVLWEGCAVCVVCTVCCEWCVLCVLCAVSGVCAVYCVFVCCEWCVLCVCCVLWVVCCSSVWRSVLDLPEYQRNICCFYANGIRITSSQTDFLFKYHLLKICVYTSRWRSFIKGGNMYFNVSISIFTILMS